MSADGDLIRRTIVGLAAIREELHRPAPLWLLCALNSCTLWNVRDDVAELKEKGHAWVSDDQTVAGLKKSGIPDDEDFRAQVAAARVRLREIAPRMVPQADPPGPGVDDTAALRSLIALLYRLTPKDPFDAPGLHGHWFCELLADVIDAVNSVPPGDPAVTPRPWREALL